ncbi:MAG: hypothetical protein GYB17_02275 [Gammaproteobacteria bacterium]|uniref:hypothetical protein n=1 Tax=Halomonas sp. BN3-1 TaxID=2082393 RepID=UPI0013B3BA2D|nr:hypothetical protein [Halomonas sp. BN3-1]MBR9878322.1 hypothetical protein [Gammaproteobacteria bacterium]
MVFNPNGKRLSVNVVVPKSENITLNLSLTTEKEGKVFFLSQHEFINSAASSEDLEEKVDLIGEGNVSVVSVSRLENDAHCIDYEECFYNNELGEKGIFNVKFRSSQGIGDSNFILRNFNE